MSAAAGRWKSRESGGRPALSVPRLILPMYRYRPEVLDALWRHGVRPTAATPPQIVHAFVNDLYRYELRRLRGRLVRREIPKHGYFDRVVALRRQYPLVSLRLEQWTE